MRVAHETAASRVALAPARFDWANVRRVLVVRLRSIGDTVLATPTLAALRAYLPHARIDVLLEDWVAPVLDEHADVDRIITVDRANFADRVRVAWDVRRERYDVAINLHGGTTATLLARASGATHRIGYRGYRYASLHNHLAPPAREVWGRAETHSVENNLALAGWAGVPVSAETPLRLAVTERAASSVERRLRAIGLRDDAQFALVHPAAAFDSKRWATDRFARAAEHLADRGFQIAALAAPGEADLVREMRELSRAPVHVFTDLRLPEVTALAARATVFLGNDSGIAHIAAAAGAPLVVVFGSSHAGRWRPWTKSAYEVVREELPCQPCAGYTCGEFGSPECINRVTVGRVTAALDRVLARSEDERQGSDRRKRRTA